MRDIIENKEIKVNEINVIPLASVKQENQCILNLILFKDNIPFDVTNQRIKLSALLPSGIKQEQSENIVTNKNNINITLNNSIVSESGKVELELTFIDDFGFMTSSSFYLNVIRKILDKKTIDSSTYLESVEVLIKSIKKDYDGLRKIIIDENSSANLQSQINETNVNLDKSNFNLNEKLENKRDKNISIELEDLSTSVKKAMTGGSVPVVGKNSVGNENIKESAVTTDKLNNELFTQVFSNNNLGKIRKEVLFKNPPSNLYDSKSIIEGFYLINGIPTPSVNNGYTDFIKVVPGEVLYISRIIKNDGGGCYDEKMKFLKKIQRDAEENENIFTIPEGVQYIRVNISDLKKNKETFVIKLNVTEGYPTYDEGEIEGLKITDSNIIGKLNPLKLPYSDFFNCFDKNKTSKEILNNFGGISKNEGINLSEYIPVNEGDKIGVNYKYESQGGLFDFNRKWRSSLVVEEESENWFTFIIPKGIYFIRINVTNFGLNNFILRINKEKPKRYQKFSANFDIVDNGIKDKKIYCFGDSITWLDGKTTTSFESGETVLVGYQEYLREQKALVTSFGDSGATIRKYLPTDDIQHGCIMDNIKKTDLSGYDIVTLLAGTNDVGRGLKLGVVGEEEDSVFDENTTLGALRSSIEHILINYPNIKIYIFSPFKSGLPSRPLNKMRELVEGMEKVCKIYSIPFINLLDNSHINKLTFETYLYDDLHPNNLGFENIGEIFVKTLKI